MKKLLQISFTMAIILLGLQSLKAYNFTATGQVSMMEQQVPAADIMVKLCIPGTGIFESTFTGADGSYEISAEIPDGTLPNYSLKVFDFCTGEYIIRTGEAVPEGVVEDFLICEGWTPDVMPCSSIGLAGAIQCKYIFGICRISFPEHGSGNLVTAKLPVSQILSMNILLPVNTKFLSPLWATTQPVSILTPKLLR